MKKQILLLLLPLLLTVPANAIIELRAGYGVQTPSDDSFSGATLQTMSGFNLDAIVEIPMFPVGLGLRYESMGFDVANTGLGSGTFESELKRLSLLVNYRIIDLFAYFGVIGSLGFSNEVTFETAGVATLEYDADMTYTVGVEGGVSLGLWMVGAELGYSLGNYEQSNGNNADVDFDGIYAKAIVGVGF